MKKRILTVSLLLCISVLSTVAQPQTDLPKNLFNEGFRYANGINKPYNPAKAIELFTQAANAGYGPAMNALGNAYMGNLGVTPDVETALLWFKKASSAGYVNASYNLGRLYQKGISVPQDFNEAAKYYRAGADAGDESCKNELAYFYFKGLGVTQNYYKAFALYQEIAMKGNVNAQYFLGICYRNGYGTAVNNELSKEWLKKAAEKNDRQAIHELTKEQYPENMTIVDPALQSKVSMLKNYQEKFVSANDNNIAGEYTGYAVYYDFSKTYVNSIVPLRLTLKKSGDGYEGTWTEQTDLSAGIKASFQSNLFSFDTSCQYVRNNYYSYGSPEKYQFKNAALTVKYIGDSMFLSGDVRFYSLSRKEPGHPMYIALSKKADDNLLTGASLKLALSPNPASNILKVTFTLPKAQPVALQLRTIEGYPLQRIEKTMLPAGTYSYEFDVHALAAGTYVMQFVPGKEQQKEISKTFIKL